MSQNSPHPEESLNPYAPVTSALVTAHPAAAGIALGDRMLLFSGQLTHRDVSQAIGNGPGLPWLAILGAIVVLQTLMLFRALLAGQFASPISIVLLVVPVLGLVWAISTQLAVRRAGIMLRRHPRMLAPHRGRITGKRIYIESSYGWTDLRWDSIAGIRARKNHIALALNPQHANVIVLPQRFFAPDDWTVLHSLMMQMSIRLPFRTRSVRTGDPSVMITGEIEPLENIPPGAIELRGLVGIRDVLRSGYGRRITFQFARILIPVLLITAAVCWWLIRERGLQGSSGIVGMLVWLVPLLIGIRMARFVIAASSKTNAPLLRLCAAAGDEGLWVSTPKGKSFSRWSGLTDRLVSDQIAILRETPHSISLIPLPRSCLVQPERWEELRELLARDNTQSDKQNSPQ